MAEQLWTDEEREDARYNPARPLLERALGTYSDRRGVYGPSEQKFADVMKALYPHGFILDRREDWVRFGLLTQIVGKLCRYSNVPNTGHVDSVHDCGVYAFMLEAEDRRAQQMAPFNKHDAAKEHK